MINRQIPATENRLNTNNQIHKQNRVGNHPDEICSLVGREPGMLNDPEHSPHFFQYQNSLFQFQSFQVERYGSPERKKLFLKSLIVILLSIKRNRVVKRMRIKFRVPFSRQQLFDEVV